MENKEMTGVMFPNTKTTEKSPDLRGSVKIGGVDYEVAAWKRQSKNGLDYLSLAIQKKGERPQKQEVKMTPATEVVKEIAAIHGIDLDKEKTEVDEPLPF